MAEANEGRLALIIGNSEYKLVPPLRNPVNDARAMAKILQQAGFKVLVYDDLTQKKLKKVIRQFGEELLKASVGLFFYAGHAVQVNGRNYLIPVDADIQFESDIEIESIDLSAVLSKMEGARTALNLVILDACRDNPFLTNSRRVNQGLAFTAAPSGTLIAYSTAPGHTASDGMGENGVYTNHLIHYMQKPGQRVEDLFKQVRKAVKKETKGAQVPWESSSLEEDFYFFKAEEVLPEPEERIEILSIERGEPVDKVTDINLSIDSAMTKVIEKEEKDESVMVRQESKEDVNNLPVSGSEAREIMSKILLSNGGKKDESAPDNIIANLHVTMNQKLLICDDYFVHQQYYNDFGDNAFHCYQKLLDEYRTVPRAVEGLMAVADIYKDSFRQELDAKNLDAAQAALEVLKKMPAYAQFVQNAEQSLTQTVRLQPENKSDYICSDLREKETFSGTMGFNELTIEEQAFLYSKCP